MDEQAAGIITALVQQQHNRERVSVFIDGDFAFGLNILDAAQLQRGQRLTQGAIDELVRQDTLVEAANRAAEFLAYRPRSTQETRTWLAKRGLSEADCEAVIDRLGRLGYLDDRAFARYWVENRLTFRPMGGRGLRYELRQKGIAADLTNEVLAELLDEGEAAYAAASKRLRRYQGATETEFRTAIGSYLLRRGFSYETANAALDRCVAELTETTPEYFKET
jgi:regulatory protein